MSPNFDRKIAYARPLLALLCGVLLAAAGCGNGNEESDDFPGPQADARAPGTQAIGSPVIPEDVKEEVRFRVDSGYNVGIVVGMVNSTGTAYFGYGATAVGTDRTPNEDTVFEIGSITKVFTTLLLVDMARTGEVSLDDLIEAHLPSRVRAPEPGGQSITLMRLATHTSGLPRVPSNLDLSDPNRPYAGYTVEKMYDFLARFSAPGGVGDRYSYSNLGGGLLGHVLELGAGRTYEELVTERITAELGMPDTRIASTPAMRQRLARGHSGVVEMPNWENTTLAGSGRLLSTARDLVTFLAANMGLAESPLLPSMRTTHEPRHPTGQEGLQIGLGWHIRTVGDSEVVWHDGGTGGYSSYTGFVKGGGTGVVVLSNTFQSVNDIGRHLLVPSVPLKVLPTPAQVDAATLERYVGSYEFGRPGVITIGQRHGHLIATLEGEATGTLYPQSDHRFYYMVADAKITFVENEEGEIGGLILHQGRTDRAAVRAGADPESILQAALPSEIILVPYTNESFGIRGVVPAGWVEFIPGGYKRASSDHVAIYQQVAGGGVDLADVMQFLADDIGLGEVPEIMGVHEANGVQWRLYVVQFRGLFFDIAVADHGTLFGTVVLRSEPSVREFYRAEVFMPAIEALTVIR